MFDEPDDKDVLNEIKDLKKDKSFKAVINKKRLDKYELDESLEF